jgi:hypothetical protein
MTARLAAGRRPALAAAPVLACALALALAGGGAHAASTAGAQGAGRHAAPTAPARAAGATAALAYVTATATSPATVWVANAQGGEQRRLGGGSQPLLSPDGATVAASLSGAAPGSESGPALVLYPVGGAPALTYLSLAAGTALPLAWSPDSRYLAVAMFSNAVGEPAGVSTLAVLDTSTGTLTTVARGWAQGASFAVDGSDRLVYGLTRSLSSSASVNLYTSAPDGSGAKPLTRDGRSLNPLWGRRGIVFDRERLRHDVAPEYQLWLLPSGGGAPRRLTSIRVGALVDGLVPLAVSADGSRLLAQFEGQDTSEAWTVTLSSRRARRLAVRGREVMGAGISRSGASVLVNEGALGDPPSAGRVARVPFGGGAARVLVSHGSQASWNQ